MLSSFIAVDTETTGLDFENDRIIELAAVKFAHGVPIDTFSALLSPGDRAVSPVARLITGISDAELAAAPPRTDTLRAFLAFAGDAPLVAHNAEFDEHFVKRALEAEGLPPVPGVWIDTLLLTRIAWPTWESHRLDSLAERLAVPRDDEHRALPDARRAGYVCLAAQRHLLETLSADGWNQLARLSSGLKDWGLVFTADRGMDATDRKDDGSGTARIEDSGATALSSGQAEREIEGAGQLARFAENSIAEELDALTARAAANHNDAWHALETPVGLDENATALAAARAHLAGAGKGQRLLLAVPDAYAWNRVRKTFLPPREGGAASGTPKMVALADPSGYLCRARLAELTAAPTTIPPIERANLLPLVAWADRAMTEAGHPGPVADGRGFSPDRARLTWSRVCCDTWDDDASARAARNAAAASSLILVTHATLCAHVRGGGSLLPACDTVLVVGAHRFPDVAQSPAGAGRMISLFRLREILQLEKTEEKKTEDAPATASEADAQDPWFAADRELQKFLQKVGKQAGKSGNDFRIRYTEPIPSAFGVDAAPLLEALRVNEAAAATDSCGPRTAARLRAFRADLEFLCAAENADAIYWVEDGANPHKTTLRSQPLALEAFGAALRDLFGAGLFLSPALLAGGNASRDGRWFLRAAGLQETEGRPAVAVRKLAPSFLTPAYFAMTPFAPAPNAGEQMEAYARFLADVAGPFAARGVLVFCPSQTAVRALHHALTAAVRAAAESNPDAEPVAVRAQWIDGNRDAVARLYAAGRGGFVIASEGIPGLRDGDGHAPALWLLTRMPLPPPRDPVLDARGEPLRAEGHNVRAELWQPAAVLRIKREWALLHREGAQAPRAIWLLDARAATEGLGARLGEALGADVTVARGAEELRDKTRNALDPHGATTSPQQ